MNYQIRRQTHVVRNLISRAPLCCIALAILLALACFALSLTARAVTPAPDGGYANGNTAEGDNALLNLTTGSQNTALGFFALGGDTIGSGNTAIGFEALLHNDRASHNTATGYAALFSNTSLGGGNTANGFEALYGNTTGYANTATGAQALFSNTTGNYNTATGAGALLNNTTGYQNTANGNVALSHNTTGVWNTATGYGALEQNTTGGTNTATGMEALLNNTTADQNTANGFQALANNTTGNENTATGYQALIFNNGNNNIAMGFNAGSNLTTGSNNIDIGAVGVAGEANKIRIGKQGTQNGTFIAGIAGVAVVGSPVVVNSNGKLGVSGASSMRFKQALKPMDKASDAILALKPVTFRYKEEIDPDGIPQFGLVAEDVEKVDPQLVTRDQDGKPYAVRYDAVNAMLLNEFLKEHRTVEQLKEEVAALKAMVMEQAGRIQRQPGSFEATVSKGRAQ